MHIVCGSVRQLSPSPLSFTCSSGSETASNKSAEIKKRQRFTGNKFGHILQTAMYWTTLAQNQVAQFVMYIWFQVYWDQMVTLKLYLHTHPSMHKHTAVSYVYWTVHHLDSWIKRDQLDVTCFIISLFTAQHVSDVNTHILRSLRLIWWVIAWVV